MTGAALSLRNALDELASVVRSLTLEQYTARDVGPFGSSIGAHVRHCLDHVAALLSGARTGRIDYERRERGTPVEIDRQAALVAIERLRRGLDTFPSGRTDAGVRVVLRTDPALPPEATRSSLGRETAFVVSHITHHNAIVGAMIEHLGGRVPERFGYAPGTIAFMEKLHVHRDDRPAA